MLGVVGGVVCASFFLCWSGLLLANLIQIVGQNSKSKQILNYYLSRTNAVFAIGMSIDNLATLADYFLVGKAFEAMFVFGAMLKLLMANFGLVMLSFVTYQVLLVAYTLGEVVANDNAKCYLRKRFIAINAGSTVWTLVVEVIMLVLNKRWLDGLIKIMWAVVMVTLGIYFWYYSLMIIRSAQTLAEALMVKRARNPLRKPVLTTALLSILVLGLIGTGALDLLDMETPHHRDYMEPYVPVAELMLLLGCTTATYFAWLPFVDKRAQMLKRVKTPVKKRQRALSLPSQLPPRLPSR
jgi:hypothetical protein